MKIAQMPNAEEDRVVATAVELQPDHRACETCGKSDASVIPVSEPFFCRQSVGMETQTMWLCGTCRGREGGN